MPTTTEIILLAAALTAFGMPAQQEVPALSHVEAIGACLTVADDARRLACLDRAGRALVDAAGRREVVVVDGDQVRKTRRSLFGFQLPRIGLFGSDGPDKGQQTDRIEGKITSVSTLGYGKFAIAIEGIGRWSTTEAWPGGLEPRRDQTVVVRRGTLGGYFMTIGKGRAVRAIRTE